MPKREYLTKSSNGLSVYFDPINSHTATHFSDTPQLRLLAKEVIEQSILKGKRMDFDIDLGRIVGTTDLVKNNDGDKIIYAKRKNRDVYTSFNKSRKPQPSSLVSVGLSRQPDGTYELLSTWIGSINSPPFPGNEYETPESRPYWMAHSLVWGTQEVQAGTEISDCPW